MSVLAPTPDGNAWDEIAAMTLDEARAHAKTDLILQRLNDAGAVGVYATEAARTHKAMKILSAALTEREVLQGRRAKR